MTKESSSNVTSSNGSAAQSTAGSYNHSLMMGSVGSGNLGLKFDADDTVSMLDGSSSASMPQFTSSGGPKVKEEFNLSNYDAAEAAVAKLGSIMDNNYTNSLNASLYMQLYGSAGNSLGSQGRGSGDDDEESVSSSADVVGSSSKRKASIDCDDNKGKKKKQLSNERREERNMREKERSLKITQQIHELRNLLSLGGVIVPKGTKSTILTEAANYIRLLQQHQQRFEVEKQQLVNEVQRISNGAIGPKAAVAIRHVAAQNGVYNVANLGDASQISGVPQSVGSTEHGLQDNLSDTLQDREYRCVFNSCSVGMAIATMGGSIIDCNVAFTQLSNYTKQELKAMTIFNLTSREDLQGAFDMMSKLITPPPQGGLDADGNNVEDNTHQPPVILRSSIRHRNDLGLSVSLIRGEDCVARYFNVTLVKLPPSPMGLNTLRPIPATADMAAEVPTQDHCMMQQTMGIIHQQQQQPGLKNQLYSGMNTPHYTSG